MSPLNSWVAGRDEQRGAIGLMAALTLSLALLCMLVVVDSGRLYLEKRSLQRVADMAALEAASRKGTCLAGSTAVTYANQSATRNSFVVGNDGRTLTTNCGSLSLDASSKRVFTANANAVEAIKVVVSHSVPRSIAAGIGAMFDTTPRPLNTQLSATAVAAATPPLAALTIRSTTLTVDSGTGALLDAVVGGLLGGGLHLDVAGWQSLVGGNVNLLSYLNQLKTDLNLTAVGYTEVLSQDISIGQLLDSATHVLSATATASTSTAIASLATIKAAAGPTKIVLGNLLNIQTSSDIAALNTTLGLFDLVQGTLQVANKNTGVTAATTVNVPLVGQVSIQLQVIQPPQLSAIGDPSKIDPANPTGTNRIYVRTAQTRALISLNLPLLSGVSNVTNAATSLLTPLTPILNSALSLNIGGVLNAAGCLLGSTCTVSDYLVLPSSTNSSVGPTIDVSIDVGSAQTYVTGYTCVSNTSKTLTTHNDTSLLNLKIGQISSAQAFPSSTTVGSVIPKPLAVLDIGTKTCKTILGIGSCTTRVPFAGGGVGVSVDTSLGQASSTVSTNVFSYPNLNEIGSAPSYLSMVAAVKPSNLLNNTVSGLQVQVYKPASGNALGNLIVVSASILSDITNALNTAIAPTLTRLLTSVVDPLFTALGITLAPADVGANLSCNFGQATLVI